MRGTDASLGKFIRNECANYNKHYGTCVTDKNCVVEEGKRCGYFERAVLGPKDYRHRLPLVDYEKMFALYSEATGKESETVTGNRCRCGANLPPRKRYCNSCRVKRRRQTKKQYQHKFRQRSTVNENMTL